MRGEFFVLFFYSGKKGRCLNTTYCSLEQAIKVTIFIFFQSEKKGKSIVTYSLLCTAAAGGVFLLLLYLLQCSMSSALRLFKQLLLFISYWSTHNFHQQGCFIYITPALKYFCPASV